VPTIYVENKEVLPERKAFDFYPTPIEFVEFVLTKFYDEHPYFLDFPVKSLDPGCGDGVWGKGLERTFGNLLIHKTGIDLRDVSEYKKNYDVLLNETDFLSYEFDQKFDLIVGNPPFSVDMEFIDKSLSLLNVGGYLGFLLKLSFLESKVRYKKYFSSENKPKHVWVSVRRISFTKNKKSNADAYCFVLWQKGWSGDTILDWLDWDYSK